VADPAARAAFQGAWGVELPQSKGLGVREVFEAASSGRVKAMLVVGDSPGFSNGELGDVLEAAQKLEFLVVQDAFLTGLAQVADVVLPSVSFAEKEGTYTNLERRVQPLRKVLEVKSTQARPDWWIVCQIARAMSAQGFDYASPSQVMEEISRLVPLYAGVSYPRLLSQRGLLEPMSWPNFPIPSQLYPAQGGQRASLQWPCTSQESGDTPILYAGGFPRGKARLAPLEVRDVPIPTTVEYPLLLLPGRVLHQPHRGAEIQVAGHKSYIGRDELLEIHPSDAADLGIGDGDWVEVISPGTRMRLRAQLTERALRGAVSATLLFGGLASRLESSEDPDPFSRVPGLKVLPVRLEKAV